MHGLYFDVKLSTTRQNQPTALPSPINISDNHLITVCLTLGFLFMLAVLEFSYLVLLSLSCTLHLCCIKGSRLLLTLNLSISPISYSFSSSTVIDKWKDAMWSNKTLIFGNTKETYRGVEHVLRMKDTKGRRSKVWACHNTLVADVRNKNLRRPNRRSIPFRIREFVCRLCWYWICKMFICFYWEGGV